MKSSKREKSFLLSGTKPRIIITYAHSDIKYLKELLFLNGFQK